MKKYLIALMMTAAVSATLTSCSEQLPDPIGRVTKMETRPNGLIIGKRQVPLGVIAIIYEARPNVTVDAAVLCLKSGNVCILRDGKEAIRSNRCAAALMRGA